MRACTCGVFYFYVIFKPTMYKTHEQSPSPRFEGFRSRGCAPGGVAFVLNGERFVV